MTRIGLFSAGLFSIQAAATTQGTSCVESDFSLSPPAAEIARDLSSTAFPTATFNENCHLASNFGAKSVNPVTAQQGQIWEHLRQLPKQT